MTLGAPAFSVDPDDTRAVKAMRRPSGDHTGGPVTPSGRLVRGWASPPSNRSRQICALPSRLHTKASVWPSGDQRGCEALSVPRAKHLWEPSLVLTTHRLERA